MRESQVRYDAAIITEAAVRVKPLANSSACPSGGAFRPAENANELTKSR